MEPTFLNWIAENRVGDFASIAGVIISVIGFVLTVYNVVRSREAAELAQRAAQSTRDSIETFETVIDLSSVIGMLEETKRAHRNHQWAALPDRYAILRKTLIAVRQSHKLSDRQAAVLQGAIANLRDMEQAVERLLPDVPKDTYPKFNALLSENIDELTGVLAEIKFAETGAQK